MNGKGEKPRPGFTVDELKSLLFGDLCEDDDLMTVGEITTVLQAHMPDITYATVDYRMQKAREGGLVERYRIRRTVEGRVVYLWGYRKAGGGKLVGDDT